MRIAMIKKIDTDFGTYYFDSISFTLSSSPEYKNTSSAEELEEMERQTLELLAKLDNGGD